MSEQGLQGLQSVRPSKRKKEKERKALSFFLSVQCIIYPETERQREHVGLGQIELSQAVLQGNGVCVCVCVSSFDVQSTFEVRRKRERKSVCECVSCCNM